MTTLRHRLLAILLAGTLLPAACGGSSPAQPTVATSAPQPAVQPSAAPSAVPPTAAPRAQVEPDGQRILGYVQKLADEIGPRPAGTAKEQAAIDFIAAQLRAFGYDVSIQEFAIGSEASRDSTLSVSNPGQRTISSVPFERSGAGRARGRLFFSGLGYPGDFAAGVSGNIALLERGELQFQQKVANAVAAGAKGVIIFNNEPGTFLGALSQSAAIPVVSISQTEGQTLLRDLENGNVEADVAVGTLGNGIAHNVIAKPPGQECETVTGGHFDSVPIAPGASDNATGTATAMEIAGVLASNGQMGRNCFALWGAEELGLIGSKAYVNSLSAEQRRQLKAVLNLDMVGVGSDTWLLIGNANLQNQGQAVAAQIGMDNRKGQLSGTSSDHASFNNAGIPALMLHRWEDPLLHTPQDVSGRVRPELLQQAAKFGVAFLLSLSSGGG